MSYDSNTQLLLEYANTKDRNLRNQLAIQNMSLVYFILKQFKGRNKSLSYGDLIQEGTIGLIRAIETFDVNRGITFSTYACRLIYCFIVKALQYKDRFIRVPETFIKKIEKYKESYQRLSDLLLREPTLSELSNEMNMPEMEIKKIQMYIAEPLELSEATHYAISEEEGLTEPSPTLLHVGMNDFKQLLLLFGLNERQIKILFLRFGLFQERPRTEREIASLLGMTRSNVAMFLSAALRSIKTSRFRDLIEECMESSNSIPEKVKKLQGKLI